MMMELFTTFCLSFVYLLVLRKIGKRVGLVDKPNERKRHKGSVPLVGGLSIYLTIVTFFILHYPQGPKVMIYLTCITALMICGVIDDKYDINFKVRLFIQAGVAVLAIVAGDISLHQLGNLFGYGIVVLPDPVACLITVFAVMGAINAFNMVDGIDGLLGALATVTFASLGFVSYQHGNMNNALLCALFIAAMLPYIFLNLGSRYKIFMGDAGSILIGFTLVWLLLSASQREVDKVIIHPITALWIIAIPLMDMAAIMIRRIRKGQSPFKPDREHLHHICQRLGLSPTRSLIFITLCAIAMAAIGLLGDMLNGSESIMLILFLSLFVIYLLVMSNIWKVVSFIRRTLGLAMEMKTDV